MEDSLVSIIMGVYNAQETISTCIDSIINQDYHNWEFIICDDCSTDETLSIVKKYAQKDSRIKVIQNTKNEKLAYSLNHCLKYSSGEYIARMDGDDIALPHRLRTQVEFLKHHSEYQLVGSCSYVDDGSGEQSIKTVKEIPESTDLLYGAPFMHPTIMMRKSAYDALKGYTVSWRTQRGQDLDLWFRFYAKGYKGYNLQLPLLVYHQSLDDFKKISWRNAWMYFLTTLNGYHLIAIPFYKYPIAFKPLLSAAIPNRIRMFYHQTRRDRK